MSTWTAGAAEVVITPPVGGEMDGYGARKSGSTGVHDDLLAHALVLDDGQRRAAVVTCDVLFVDAPTVAAVRRATQERWDIPPERVLVCATHTRQGPKGLTGFRSAADTELLAILARQIVGAIEVAVRNLAPARLMAGTGHVDSVSLTHYGSDFTSRQLEQVAADPPMTLDFSAPGVPHGRNKIGRRGGRHNPDAGRRPRAEQD